MKKYLHYSLVFVSLLIIVSIINPAQVARADSTSNLLTGYAWSSTIGWISFSGTGYGVSMDPTTGALTGHAWSDHIGWISFNAADVAGCPIVPANGCAPMMSGGTVTGWARALTLSAYDGDGWISMSGTGPNYGVSYNSSTLNFSGYSWGSDIVGWILWNLTSPTGPCNPATDGVCGQNSNAPVVTIGANPTTVDPGSTTTLTWSATNNPTSCGLTSSPFSNTVDSASEASTSLGTITGDIDNGPITFTMTCTNSSGTGFNSIQVSTTTVGGNTPTVSCNSPSSATVLPSSGGPSVTVSANNASGGTSPYTYTLYDGNGHSMSGQSASFNYTNTTPNDETYTPYVTATDHNAVTSASGLCATVTVLHSTNPNPGGSGVLMWLNNSLNTSFNPPTYIKSIHIHPSGHVTLNWDEGSFVNQYSANGAISCKGVESSGPSTISSWNNATINPQALNNNQSPTILSGLSVGIYSLDVQCQGEDSDRVTSVYSTTNPVTITVTNSTIHEQ